MVEGWFKKDLIELALWDVLHDLTQSLASAAGEEAKRCATPEEFEVAWSELTNLAFSNDSIELVLERYRQFEADGERESAARQRREEWLKQHPPKKEE